MPPLDHPAPLLHALQAAGVACALVVAGCTAPPDDPLLQQPTFAVEAARPWIGSGTLLVTPPVADAFHAAGAQLVDPTPARAAMQNPEAFRALDREQRLAGVVLAGPPATYRPLLQYLGTADGWTLVHLDHLTVLFKRGPAEAWDPAQIGRLRDRLAIPSRPAFLSGAGLLLLESGKTDAARRALEEAESLGDHSPATQAALAAVDALQERWDSALARADKILARDKQFPAALYVRGQALFALHRFDEALAVAEGLLRRYPSDPQYLLLHAKAAHETHDYEAEIASLRKLIAQMESQGITPGGYRIYLGQALSARHDGQGARAEFERALREGGLNASQIDFARRAIERLGGKPPAPAGPSKKPGR